eukprot:NODE_893_length_3243_cov_0.465967.p2 type:complete len:273 gc:universal NODE_893_length_3243_cov_0.465967:1839-1021(-)
MDCKLELGKHHIGYKVGKPLKASRVYVCMPGMGDSISTYRFLAKQWEMDGYGYILIDLRGYGLSSINWQEYTPESLLSDLLQVLQKEQDWVKSNDVYLMGNSFAACPMMLYCSQPLQWVKLKGIIVTGPILRVMPADNYFYYFSYLMFNLGFISNWLWMSYYKSLFKTVPSDFDDIYKQNYEYYSKHGKISILGQYARSSKENTFKCLKHVNVRTALIIGLQDPDYSDPKQEMEILKKEIKDAHGLLLDNCGHYPQAEHPQQVLDFIKSVFQ